MAGKPPAYPSTAGWNTAIPEGWQRLAPALTTIVRVRPGAAPVVSARGELDIACAGTFEDLVLEVIIRHGPDVVIDASGLSFCDARGLGALVRCANEATRSGGRLTLADPDHRLRRLLRIVHLDHLM